MKIVLEVPPANAEAIIDSYEREGFSLHKRTTVDRDTTILELIGPTKEIPDKNAKMYLEFLDGTISPLYIRRNILDDDD
jgi:hypothetical protein